MSDTREKIAKYQAEYLHPSMYKTTEEAMAMGESMADHILSIVREAVSAVKPNYKSYDDGEMSTAAKVADDYHDALMEVLS